jgi:hypothetical protein
MWGWNQHGTLGHLLETKTESYPVLVNSLTGLGSKQKILIYMVTDP